MADTAPIIVWFRDDLRLGDHPALFAAAQTGRPIIPLYMLPPELGGAARWWLHHSLLSLARSLEQLGCRLILRRGDPALVVPSVARETGAAHVHFSRRFDPRGIANDRLVVAALEGLGVGVRAFKGTVLQPPAEIHTQSGEPFRVFTPFWRVVRGLDPGTPLPAPRALGPFIPSVTSDQLDDWQLCPTRPDWAGGLRATWVPGEAAAQAQLAQFLDLHLDRYDRERDFPAKPSVSRLSPRLRWGELSPRQIWHATLAHSAGRERAAEKFLAELGWREFSYHLLTAEPHLPERSLRPEFERFPWQPDPAALKAWQQGRTGYPLVDAGMRELWHTGWMHNRVRMVVGSFLVKHLLQPWQAGADWFLDTLVDADIAANSQNWQWVTGCGTDAAPYFRIFNPTLQAQKFDPGARYIRRWVPERAEQSDEAACLPLNPMIDHDIARNRALAAFASLKAA